MQRGNFTSCNRGTLTNAICEFIVNTNVSEESAASVYRAEKLAWNLLRKLVSLLVLFMPGSSPNHSFILFTLHITQDKTCKGQKIKVCEGKRLQRINIQLLHDKSVETPQKLFYLFCLLKMSVPAYSQFRKAFIIPNNTTI